MVAIVSGNSLGLSLSSLATLGQRGVWGRTGQGGSGEQAYVNAATGNLVLQHRDDLLVGRGLDLAAVRTYNSQGFLNDDNGDNWNVGAHDQRMEWTGTFATVGSTLVRTDRDSARAGYGWDAARNLYVSSGGAGAFDTIAYDAATSRLIWTDGDTGMVERYQASGQGRLLSASDASGNTVSYAYNANGTVQSVTDANGEVTFYDYSGYNLTQIRTVAGGVTTNTVRYAYDSANRLSKVTVDLSPEDNSIADGKVYTTSYTYDGTSRRVASVAQSDGTLLSFTYVQTGDAGSVFKVSTVTDALGQITRFAYDAARNTTTVTDPLGAQSTYLYDTLGQLTQVRGGVTAANATGLSQVSYLYDAQGNVTRITDGEGREVAYAYDANGNLLKETDSAGDVRTRTYNAANQLLTDTVYADAAVSRGAFSKEAALPETTRYVYAEGKATQLRFVIGARGDVTEYRYDNYGQRIATVRYAGAAYKVSDLGLTEVPAQTLLAVWAGQQDLTRTERTDYSYDARGALSASTTYGEVDASGVGTAATAARTQYVYDQRGLLLKTIDPAGGTVTYVYDGLGRVLSVSAPSLDGGATPNTTITSYDDANGKTSVTIASGLVTVSAYDKAGRLVSVTQQSAGTGVLGSTTYAYDKDGNLLMTQDPTGVRRWMLYDEANRKIADIDATGALVEYVYNASGQLRQTIAYATRLSAAKLPQLVDGTGQPTAAWSATNTTTSLAALRPATSTQDQRVWRFYDSAGRLAWQVDALGYVTQTTYDGASRILAVTQLAKPIDVTPLLKGADVDLGVDPSTLGGIALSLDNPEQAVVGAVTTLTATFEGGGIDGMVTFFDGETVIGSALSIDGKVVLVTDRLSVGTHNLRVAYSGDALRPASVSKAIKKVITPAVTAANLNYTSPVAGSNGPLTLSLAVTGGPAWLAPPAGKVVFYNGEVVLGEATVVDGIASLSLTSWPTVSEVVKRLPPGLASAILATGLKEESVLKVLSSAIEGFVTSNDFASGSISFSQIGTWFEKNSDLPGGKEAMARNIVNVLSVAFLDKGITWTQMKPILRALASDLASLSLSGRLSNKLNVRAEYAGDAVHTSAVAQRSFFPVPPSLTLNVDPTFGVVVPVEDSVPAGEEPKLTLTASTDVSRGEAVTLNVQLTQTDRGYISFFAGTQYLGTIDASVGEDSLVVNFLPKGTYQWSATFSRFGGQLSHLVAKGGTTTITADQKGSPPSSWSQTPSKDAGSGLFDVNVQSGVSPIVTIAYRETASSHVSSGMYSLFDGDILIGSVLREFGPKDEWAPVSFSLWLGKTLPPGTHALRVVHEHGNLKEALSTSFEVLPGNVGPAPIVSNGEPVTLRVKVVGASPGGTVAFFAGNLLLGTGVVVDGVVTLVVDHLRAGSYALSATYADVDGSFSGVRVQNTTLQVDRDQPNKSSFDWWRYDKEGFPDHGYEIQINSGNIGQPGGAVQVGIAPSIRIYDREKYGIEGMYSVFVDGALVGSVIYARRDPVWGREFTFTLPVGLPANRGYGLTLVSSNVVGGGYSPPSVINVVVQVDLARTSTVLGASPSSAPADSPVTLNARVSMAPPDDMQGGLISTAPPVGGVVTFYANGVIIGTATAVNGLASLVVSNLPQGMNGITASYSGDDNYLGSQTSGALSLRVTKPLGTPVTLTNLTTPSIAKDGALSVRVTGKTAPSGLVSFYSGTTLLGTVAVLEDGTATLRGVPIPVGTHTFSAAYSGDEANADGAITFTQVVEGTPSTPVLIGFDAAQDRTVTQLLNRNGRVQGVLDGEGYLTEYKYNAAGEQVQSIRYANRAASFTSVSARLMATAIARASGDLAGVRPAASDGDIRSYTFYNARGQAVGQIDGEGYLTETIDDTRGNVTQTRRYFNPAKNPGAANATLATIRPDPSAQDQSVTQTWSTANQLLSRTNVEGTVTTFTYDVAGRLVQTTTAAGTPDEHIQRLRYDIQGHLIGELDGRGSDAVALTDPLAAWAANGATHTYDPAGRRTSTTDANGHRTLFFYDAFSRLTYTVNALGEATENRYDALGQLSEQIVYCTPIDVVTLGATTPGGLNTTALASKLLAVADAAKDSRVVRSYNATGTLASRTDAMGAVTSYSYNAFREAIASSQTRLNGQAVTNTVAFDRRGLQVSTTLDSSGLAITHRTSYDAFGRPDTRIDANGNTSSLRYDRLGRVVTTTDANGATRTTTYDAFDRVLTQRDALNNVTSYAYDVASRSVTMTTPEGISVTTVHNRQGQTTSVTDGLGNPTTYSYDKSGNLLQTQAPEAVGTSATYDKTGLKLSTTDAKGTVTTYGYDAANRLLTRTVDPSGLKLVTSYLYDAKGQTVSVTDPGGTVTTTAYDLNGQVVRQTVDPAGLNLQTVYTHDTDGTTLTVQSPDGRLVRYTYDGAGRRIKEQVDPLGLNLARSYVYDAQGNVIKAVDASGNATLFIYDKANRLVFTIDAMGGVQQNSYDAEGRLSSQTTYAALVPVATWNGVAPSLSTLQAALPTLGLAATQSRRYDRDGRLRFTVDATGAVVEYRYDANGNVVEARAYAQRIDLGLWSGTIDPPVVADDVHDQRSRSVYDALGRKTFGIDGTGAVVRQVFDASGNVTERFAYSTRIPVATTSTANALAAAVALVADAARDAHDIYVYDRAGRLGSHTDGMGALTTQTYDKNGNVTSRTDANNQVTRYAYDSAARLVYTLGPLGQLEKNSYDAAGRITLTTRYAKAVDTTGLGAVLTVAQLQALAVQTPGQDSQQYAVYDKSGRLSATVDAMGSVVTFVRDGNGSVTERTAWANPIDLATWVPGTAPTPQADAVRDQHTRIFYDGMGREALTVDALGYAVQRQYDASGRLTYVVRYPVAVPATTANTQKAQLDAAVQFASTSGQPLQITAYGYDSAGNRTSQTQALGQPEAATTRYVFDGIGRLTRTIDPRGVELSQSDSSWALTQRLQLKYLNAAGGALKASDLSPAQRQALAALYTTVNDYDAAGHKLSVTDAQGGVTRSEYDATGHVVKITDPRGNAAFYYFDAAGRVTLSVDPEGYATATTYDTLGHTLSVKRYFNRVSGTYGTAQPPALPGVNPSDALTRFEYDAAGHLTKMIDAESNAESYTYNTLGQRQTLTNKLGGISTYTYDRLGQMASETLPITSRNAAGQSVAVVNQYAYDAFGNKTTTTEAAGLPEQRVTQFRYDGLNREIEQRQAQVSIYVDGKGWTTAAPTRTRTYDASGNLIVVVDPNGGRTRTWFDASNRKVAEVSATGTLSTWSYDAAGNVMAQRVYGDALALPASDAVPTPVNTASVRLTTYQVDANNRVTRSTIAGVQSGDYDAKGHQYNMAVTSDVVKRSFYDANGNVVREQNGKDAATLVWFDKLGQKVLEVDAMGYGVRWERDANGAVLRQTRYLQGIELGSLSESTAMADVLAKFRPATGDQITEYSYDRNARVLSESRLNVVYGSVAANGALSEASTTATQRTVYDAMGNKSATIDAQGQRSDMRYDALGRLLGTQRPGAADFNGTLVRQATDYEYDGLGNVRREIRRGTDNAVETDDQIVRYGYDATGVRTSMTTAKGETISYGRDADGNTTAQMTDRVDADGAVSRDIVSIGYDAANREVRRFTGQRDAANVPVFDVANTITLGYNTFGELTSKRTGSGNAQGQAQEYYDYDKAGRLWRTNSQGGVNKAWMYDLAGNATLQLESQRVDLRAMTWEQIAGDGTHPNPDILITITSYDQNNHVVSVMQPKMDASRPNLRMYAAPINVDSGKFGGLDIDVAPALAEANSTWIAGPSDGSATGQVGALGMSISGGNIRPIRNGEFGGAGGWSNISSTVVGVTDIVLGSSGNLENLYGALTWRVEVGGVANYLGRPGSWPVTVHPRNADMSVFLGQLPGTLTLHRGIAYSNLVPIRVVATTASGLDIVVSNGAVRQPPLPTVDQTLSGTFMRLTGSEARDTDTIQLYSRPRGSNGPFSLSLPIFKAGQGGSSLNNVAIDGAYLTRLDGQGPLDMLLIVTQSDGTVVRRQSIQYDPASGQSSSSVAPAQPVFTSDNVAHFTGLRINGSAIRVLQRPQGSQGAYSERTYWPNGATGRFDVQFDGGASDVIIEVLDTNRNVVVDRLKGTVNPGASYYDMRPLAALPSSITFRDIPIDARTLQIEYEPLSPGGLSGSITIPRSAAGDIAQWVWDAANLIPDKRSLYSYKLHFVARDEDGFILSDATGEATIGAMSKEGTKARLTGNVKHQVMTFDPGIAEGRTMKLRYREKGATAQDFTEATATRVKANTAFKWDATANNLDPAKEYEFVYDVYNAAGAVIGNGEGYFRLNNSADNKDVRWGIPNLPGEDVINNSWVIQRRQTYDGFGHIVKEIDGNGNVNDLSYNTLGLLLDKVGPSVDITLANGQVQMTRPSEHYSYDLTGQLVGKRDANGNQSTVQINAVGQAVAEWHPGAVAGSSAVVRKSYDVFGNLRTVTDEIGRVTNNSYDLNNRLSRIDRPVNVDGSRAFDIYDYDVLGQRIAHANALNFRERTYYDTMGRVTRYISAEGATVNYGYTYDNSIGSAGGVNTGGWVNTTTDANGRTQTLKNDVFGRAMWKQDFGGHQFTYGYNWSGLIATQTGTSGQNISYSYYDNGYLRKVIDAGVSTESTFEYDNNGNRIFEGLKSSAGDVAMVFQWSRVSYDAYNRVKTIDDARYVINYEYDANGNRRRVKSTYLNVVDQTKDIQDYWYAYDGMNRFTTTMGQLVNGQIVRGASGDGVSIEYDDAGQRKAATYAATATSPGHREDYAYDGTGQLTTMVMDGVLRSRRTNDLAGRVTRYEELNADQTLSVRKDRTWNKDNQLTQEAELRLSAGTGGLKGANTTTAYTLMADGTLSSVDTLTNTFNSSPNPQDHEPGEPNGGFNITRTINNYAYEWWDSAKQSAITLGAASTAYDPKRPQPPGYSLFAYDANGHLKSATDVNRTTPRTFSYWTNAEGQVLQRQELIGGTIAADGSISGATKSRDHRYFYFDGKRVGNVGNDGTEREDYAQQFARARATESPDNKYRKFIPTNSADFDENYQPINASYPGAAPGSYTVRSGDTLEGIARALWGDAQLWYLLAEANGLDGQPSAPLVENTVLAVPSKVTNLHNTSSTFRPYDPGKAMGDTSPTLPDPLPAPKGKEGGCGGFGQILMIVVAVVATIWTAGAASGAWGAVGTGAAGTTVGGTAMGVSAGFGATMTTGLAALGGGYGAIGLAAAVAGGAVGSIASQGVGIAIGAQDSFSWKGVALGALGAGVGAGVGSLLNVPGGLLSGPGNWATAGRMAVGNIASQGLSIATGLQKSFDWRGVAASAASGYVSAWAGNALQNMDVGAFGQRLASGMAGGIVSAAARGGSLGRALPGIIGDAVGSTVGNALGDSIANANGQSSGRYTSDDPLGGLIALNGGWAGVSATPDFGEVRAMRNAAMNPMGLPTYSAATAAEGLNARNGMDVQDDLYVTQHGPGIASTRLNVRGDSTLEGLARQTYGDNWLAGMAVMKDANNLRTNQWGSPLIYAGGTVLAPSLDGMGSDAVGKLSAAGGNIESRNAAGLNRRAQLMADAQAASDNASETQRFVNRSVANSTNSYDDMSWLSQRGTASSGPQDVRGLVDKANGMPWQQDLTREDVFAARRDLSRAWLAVKDPEVRLNIQGAFMSVNEAATNGRLLTPGEIVDGPGSMGMAVAAGGFGGSNGGVPRGISNSIATTGQTYRSSNSGVSVAYTENIADFEKYQEALRARARPGYTYATRDDGTQRYSYGSLNRGHGITGTLDAEGTLRVEVQASQNPGTRYSLGTGTEMFDGMMAKFGPQNVKQINGTWSRRSGLTDNLDSFESNYAMTGDRLGAAAQTWTGKRAASYGFVPTEVRIIPDGPRVIFRRPN